MGSFHQWEKDFAHHPTRLGTVKHGRFQNRGVDRRKIGGVVSSTLAVQVYRGRNNRPVLAL